MGLVFGYDGHLNQHGWLVFFFAYRQILGLTFPSGRMTLAVHIIERLTALYKTILVFIVSMAGPCAHEDDERPIRNFAHSELPDWRNDEVRDITSHHITIIYS